MQIEIRDINEETVKDLFPPCRGCLYWEAPEKLGEEGKAKPGVSEDEAIRIKEGWFRRASRRLSSCGKVLYVDGSPAGYAQYAPPHLFEKVGEYSRELFPPSPDAILLSCLYIQREQQGKGLGTRLLQAVIASLRESGNKALETYSRDDSSNSTAGPTSLYLENGFRPLKTKKWGEATFSLVRLELASHE